MGLVNRQWGVYSVPAYEKPGGGTSYHYQTPPLLAKKPLVVDGGRERRKIRADRAPFGRRGRRTNGAIRTERQDSRSIAGGNRD